MIDHREILRKAAEIVEAGWTQNRMACNADGWQVSIHDPGATCFCAWGAIRRALGPDHDNSSADLVLVEHFERVLGSGQSITDFNDKPRRKAEDVATWLRLAASVPLGALS